MTSTIVDNAFTTSALNHASDLNLQFARAKADKTDSDTSISALQTQPFGPNIYVPSGYAFGKIRRACARVRAGTGIGRVAFVGDSTTSGFRSGTANADSRAGAACSRLATLLNAFVVPAQASSVFGNAGTANPAAYVAYDPRIVLGSGWIFSTNPSLGGLAWGNNSTTNPIDFTPGGTFDTVDLWVFTGGGTGSTLSVQVDAQAAQTQVLSASTAFQKVSFTFTSGSVMHVSRTAGTSSLFVAGFDCYTAATRQLSIMNMGRGGWTSADWTSTATGALSATPINALQILAPDLTIIELGINDVNAPLAPATYSANMQTLITAALVSGDCWLVSFNAFDPSFGANSAQANQDALVAVLRTLAQSNSIPLLDWNGREGPYSVANALGIQADQLHPNSLGHADKAQFLARLFGLL